MALVILSTSVHSPQTATQIGSPTGGHPNSNSWNNVANIVSDNGSNATVNFASNQRNFASQTLAAKNFGFQIPSDAIICGIEVTLNRYRSGTDNDTIRDTDQSSILIHPTLNFVGESRGNFSTAWPTSSSSVVTYGASNDLWGTAWTPAEINDSDFGYGIRVTRGAVAGGGSATVTANVDWIGIKIYYSVDRVLVAVKTPSTITQSSGNQWSSVENVATSNDEYATNNGSTTSNIILSNFGFKLPSHAVVEKIDAEIDAFANPTTAKLKGIQLLKGGTPSGSILDNETTLTFTSSGAGGVLRRLTQAEATWKYSDTLWGTSWTPNDINNNSGFGFQFGALNSSATTYIDNACLKVYYKADVVDFLYQSFVTRQLSDPIDFENDTIKVALLSPEYEPSLTHEVFSDVSTYEVSGDQYTSGGSTLNNVTVNKTLVTTDSIPLSVVTVTADNVEWSQSVTGFENARYAVVYHDSGNPATSPLINLLDMAAEFNNIEHSLVLTWDNGGVLQFSVGALQ